MTGVTRKRARRRPRGSCRSAPTSTGIACYSRVSWRRTDLLIEPDSGVAVTLDEVQELAREKATDWLELASDYAERMLPQIFRKDDPVLAIALPPETQVRDGGPAEGSAEAGVRGRRQPRLGLSVLAGGQEGRGQQVRGEDRRRRAAGSHPALHRGLHGPLPAPQHARRVVGRQGAGRQSRRCASARVEDELRAACKVGDIDWTYLRFVRDKCARTERRGPGDPPPARSRAGRRRRRTSPFSIPAWVRATSSFSRCLFSLPFAWRRKGCRNRPPSMPCSRTICSG